MPSWFQPLPLSDEPLPPTGPLAAGNHRKEGIALVVEYEDCNRDFQRWYKPIQYPVSSKGLETGTSLPYWYLCPSFLHQMHMNTEFRQTFREHPYRLHFFQTEPSRMHWVEHPFPVPVLLLSHLQQWRWGISCGSQKYLRIFLYDEMHLRIHDRDNHDNAWCR